MPDASSNGPTGPSAAARSFPFSAVLLAVIVGGIAVIVYSRVSGGGLLGGSKSQKPDPPPSGAVLDAPGPDNTITRAPVRTEVPPQPPSPIESQTDLSKKPKENK